MFCVHIVKSSTNSLSLSLESIHHECYYSRMFARPHRIDRIYNDTFNIYNGCYLNVINISFYPEIWGASLFKALKMCEKHCLINVYAENPFKKFVVFFRRPIFSEWIPYEESAVCFCFFYVSSFRNTSLSFQLHFEYLCEIQRL